MHFVHILSYTWENGGPSKVVYDLAKNQIENGHKVTVITMDMPNQKRYSPINGVDVVPVSANFISRIFPLFSLDIFRMLKKNHQQFDVIHLHLLWNFTLLAAHLLKLHQKTIVTVHGCLHPYTFIGSKFKRGLFSVFFQRKFLKSVKMIHALHVGEVKEIANYLGQETTNIRIIPNGIDIKEVEKKIENCGQSVLFLSRLHQKKGIDLLLPAFKEVIKEIPEAKLILAGPDYGMLDYVQRFISENNLYHAIKWVGSVHGHEKTNLLKKSKIFVLPSYSEGFSIAVLEAMVYKLALVVSTETGLSDEIENTNAGFVVDLNTNAISKALIKLLKNDSLAIEVTKNGLDLVKSKFETSKVCSLFQDEVNQIFRK